MERPANSAESRVPWACGALVLLVCATVLLVAPREGVWTVDCGSKALQAQRLLDTGYRAFDLEYSASALDPTGRWFPVPPPYAQRYGDRYFAQYPVVYAATAAPFLAVAGPVGLRIPAALGLAACAALFAAWMLPVFGPRWSLAAGVLVALASPLAFYGITIWEHTPALALALGAQRLASHSERRRLVGAGLLMGLACWLREEMVLMGLALAIAVYAFRRRPSDLAWLLLGVLPAAAALLAFNAASLGHPLGPHVTGNVGAAHFPAAGEALRDAGAILAGYGAGRVEATALALLAVGCWIAGWLASRTARSLAPTVVVLAALSLLAWLVATVRLVGGDHPILELTRSNGFLMRMPLVALAGAGMGLVMRRPELASLRFGVVVGAGFLLLGLPFRVLLTDFLPGLHWAPRMLLPAVPAFALLGLVAIREALRASASSWRALAVAAAAGFALAGLISSAQAIRLLNEVKRETRDLERVVLALEPGVIVTDHPALGQQLPNVWSRKSLLLVRDRAELPAVAAELQRAGVRSFAYLPRLARAAQPAESSGLRCEPVGEFRGAHSGRLRRRTPSLPDSAGREVVSRSRRSGVPVVASLPPVDPTPVSRYWLVALVVAAAVFGVYSGTWKNEFVSFDDRKYLYENPLVTGDGGLAAIWGDLTNEDPRLHYYPLTFSTFWIEHSLVGLGPAPEDVPDNIGRPAHPLYHFTQAAFHAVNAALLLFLLRALGVAFVPSVVVAAIWAVHPVGVASVAWVAERKNLVWVCFGLLTLLGYAGSRRRALGEGGSGATALYGLSLVLFALALTGKAAAMTLAAMIVATDRLMAGRWQRGVVLRALPFFVLAAAAAYVVSMREAHITVSIEPVPLELRPLIAVTALVHYVTTVFFPFDQAIIYPRWEESFAVPRYWLALTAAGAATLLAWQKRSKLGDPWLWGVALFGVTVSPVLGLKHFAWMQFAFVSDHYLYLGSAGILLAAVLSVDSWRRSREERSEGPLSAYGGPLTVSLGVLVLAVLAFCSWRTVVQSRTWQNNVTLWEHTLTVSPQADVPLLNLGNHYFRRRDFETAYGYYSEWARVSPQFVRAKVSSAECLKELGRHDEALAYFEAAIATARDRPAMQASVRRDYARYLIELRRFEAARRQFEIFRETDPRSRAEIERILAVIDAQIEHDRSRSDEASEPPDSSAPN